MNFTHFIVFLLVNVSAMRNGGLVQSITSIRRVLCTLYVLNEDLVNRFI